MIREFEQRDIDAMIELGRLMFQEGAYNFLSYDPKKLKVLAENMLKDRSKSNAWVYEHEGEIVAMMAVYITEYFFSRDKICQDLLLYVNPQHRKNLFVPIRLINRSIKWAKENGAREFCPASSVALSSDKVEKLYKFMKFKSVGNIFKMRLD